MSVEPSQKALEAAQRRCDELIEYWDLTREGHEVDEDDPTDSPVDGVVAEIVEAAYAADPLAETIAVASAALESMVHSCSGFSPRSIGHSRVYSVQIDVRTVERARAALRVLQPPVEAQP